ncbi:DUF1820 family protein [Bowmanella sp. Y26]|uniref:DUF1820 family protein n=1 Tax=Bowmanella yangjiangensis TaxID=2811230 RepID=A0ABS3CS35_9ALTE|nr:DUF1820 family protein [Bowmanella yangjiangensis]MBN7819100.1 DUF1820 family protein [Bowmanella yangjiangensis]MBT1065773.1 DUF1820 family protein [Bowmanella yangjiangensis]
MSKAKPLYKVQFISNAERYEVYVREVSQGAMFGFVEIGDFVWDNHSSLLVDPSQEKLKTEFDNVMRTYIPMHNVLRIDEVKKQGNAKVTELSDKVTPFPKPIYTPKN